MDASNLHFRLMLQQYETQLVVARRLSRYRRAKLIQSGYTPPDPQRQRKAIVLRVARELYGLLLSTGTDNPMVETITEKLSAALEVNVVLTYLAPMPFMDEHLRFMRQGEGENAPLVPLSQADQMKAMHLLWKFTLETVDESML